MNVSDRNRALTFYAKALAASSASFVGKFRVPPEEIDAYIELQRKTVAAFSDGAVDSAITQAFSKFGETLRSLGNNNIEFFYPAKTEAIFRESIVILGKIVQADPENANQKLSLWTAYSEMGRIQQNRKDRDGALKSYQDALSLARTLSDATPLSKQWLLNSVASQVRIGDVLKEKGDYEDAMMAYQDALAMMKVRADSLSLDDRLRILDISDVYYQLGNMFESAGQYQLAVNAFDATTGIQPTNSEAFNGSCWNRAILGQLQDALADCNKSVLLNPNYPNGLDSRGFTYLKLGDLDRSIADYNAALKVRPRSAYSLYGRGMAKQRKGDLRGAAADISKAKEINSNIADVFARLGVQ